MMLSKKRRYGSLKLPLERLLGMLKFALVASLLVSSSHAYACSIYEAQMTAEEVSALQLAVKNSSEKFSSVKAEVQKIVYGQEYIIDRLLIALVSDGHVLLEGVPGVAKTVTAKALAHSMSGQFNRIQFTSDLMPSEITGTQIYDSKQGGFVVKKGPVFTNFLLADEINRAPPKVQSGILAPMEERVVPIGEQVYELPRPFLVLATQNPIEQSGVYPLPEAQVDRFIMKLDVGYPSVEDEMRVVNMRLMGQKTPQVNVVMSIEDILKAQKEVQKMMVSDDLVRWITTVVAATRNPKAYGFPAAFAENIAQGSSPRGTINVAAAARARAFLRGSIEVTIDDVKAIIKDVLAARIMLSDNGLAQRVKPWDIIQQIVDKIPYPVVQTPAQ